MSPSQTISPWGQTAPVVPPVDPEEPDPSVGPEEAPVVAVPEPLSPLAEPAEVSAEPVPVVPLCAPAGPPRLAPVEKTR